MADYPQLAPTLAALSATKTDPDNNEDASKLAAVDRQTRTWLYDFLKLFIDEATNKFLATGFSADSLPVGGARGATANNGVQREIATGTVSTVDLRDDAVTGAKIADDAVDTEHIADFAVESAQILAGAVIEAKIGAGAVTSTKIGAGAVVAAALGPLAVESAAINVGAVIADKIGAQAVTGPKLLPGTSGQMLVHNGTTWAAVTLSGALSMSAAGVASIAVSSTSVGWCRLSERVASGTSAGASTAASFTQKRGVLTAWVIDEQTVAGVVALGAAGVINLTSNGLYLITARFPAYSVGLHKLKILFTPVSGATVDYVGSSACAGPGQTTESTVQFILTVTGASAGTPATLTPFHYTELLRAVNGLGIAVSSGEVERYAMVEIMRLAAA